MKNRLYYKLLVIQVLLISIGGCVTQSDNKQSATVEPYQSEYPYYRSSSDQYSQYYSWLSTLTNAQFTSQIEHIKSVPESVSQQLKLALIYSHHNSPIRNTHLANKILSSQLESLSEHPQLGWFEAINDQLKDSIRWQNRFEEQQMELEVVLESAESYQQENQRLLEQLKQLTQLEQQLHDNK